ncbi:chromate efflux transporter [Actinomycetospora sp. CA-101289]|uniref:chromate efflux transporter n=1 Tax=Actinomycetospora sp. CA-101289 TaxID=3239893 RepID=UPI003D961F45
MSTSPSPRTPDEAAPSPDLVPFRAALRAWFAISWQTFGGPAGQIAVMQRELVDRRRWIGQRRFLHALNYCMLLPGPEAQQLAIYVGWLLNGVRGGLAAGTLFVLPGVLTLLVLSAIYVAAGDTVLVTALFAGLAPAVVAVVVQAVWRVGRRALTRPGLVALAVASFLALTLFGVPFPVVIAVAAGLGWLLHRVRPRAPAEEQRGPDDGPAPVVADEALHATRPTVRRAVGILAVGALLWGLPLLAVVVLTGAGSVFTTQGLFFSGTALVTFGGAYAVLAFVAQQAVQTYGWLTAGDMVRGLALAESTPGPLIMVVQFVAFLGAYHHPGGMDPWVAGVLGALLTTWVTFVPCFLFIFLGAPHIEQLRHNRALSAALTGITAAVVGVIANLAVYFAGHTFFAAHQRVRLGVLDLEVPVLSSLQPTAVVIAVVAALLIFWRGWPVLRTLGVCAVLGLLGAVVPLLL